MRHDVLPSNMMSPALLSTAKSSSSVPHLDLIGLRNDGIQCCLRDRATAGDSSQSCSAPRAQAAVYLIAKKISPIASALRGYTQRQHVENAVVLACVSDRDRDRRGATLEQRVFIPLFAATHGDNLLRHDVERRSRHFETVEVAMLR